MKYLIIVLIFLFSFSLSEAQQKKRGRVKRKFRQVEAVNRDLQPVFLRGIIRDLDRNPLPGARVIIIGTKKIVHANERGEYFFYQYETGKVRIQASLEGYETKWVDVVLQSGQNFFNLSLPENETKIEKEVGTAQNRPKQVLDMTFSNSTLDDKKLSENYITKFNDVSDYVPGLIVQEFGFEKNILSIRGVTNQSENTFGSPLISIQFNSVPINHKYATTFSYFDSKQIEVARGPQTTENGRGSVIGAVLFESNKPTRNFEGNISAGYGNFNQQEVEAMINLPVWKDKLALRAAGIYQNHDGYIENTLGGNLNGKRSFAGRFSTRFTPNVSHQIDLIVGYEKNTFPGLAFMNPDYVNENGQKSPFHFTSSLNISDLPQPDRKVFNATLIYKFFRHEHNYWTSTSSFRKFENNTAYDADGTFAPALSFSENFKNKQFFQEIMYNFSRSNNRLNGVLGGNLRIEKGQNMTALLLNEQHFYHLFFDTGELINANGLLQPIIEITDTTDIHYGMTFPDKHSELVNNKFSQMAGEGFLNFTYHFWKKFSFAAGVRGMAERTKLTHLATFDQGEPSALGKITGTSPNIYYLSTSEKELKKTTLSLAYRAGLQYYFRENTTAYFTYSKAHQPRILGFSNLTEEEDFKGLNIDHFELGVKTHYKSRVGLKAAIFYYQLKNFPGYTRESNADSTQSIPVFEHTGQAANYGGEASLEFALSKELTLFGNYTYLFTQYDSLSTSGNEQILAGQTFEFSPEHRLQIGLNAKLRFGDYLLVFARPAYTYQTEMILQAGSSGKTIQNAYGILNGTAGFTLSKYKLTFMAYGKNLLDEKYIEVFESKYMSNLQIPGVPRMFGTKLIWNF